MTTGSQQLVYEAILAGHTLPREIMAATGLDQSTVRTCILRLRDSGDVTRERTKDKRPATRYVPVLNVCLLAYHWK